MAQKTYQKIGSENLKAAKFIWELLKKEKVLSQKTFEECYCYGRRFALNARKSGSFHNLYNTTQKFLYDHELMTKEFMNGLIIYVATQKCWRSKTFENATKEVQIVDNDDIDQAIQYITVNNNMVPAEFEGPIVANMLGLEGNHWKRFVDTYKYQSEWDGTNHYGLPIKFKVISVVEILGRTGIIKKI